MFSWRKFTGNLHKKRITTVIMNYYAVVFLVWQAPLGLRIELNVFHRGQKLNTDFFFSNFSGASGISRQNPLTSRQKCLISLASRDTSNFLAPTPSRGRPLPHRKIPGLKSLGLCSLFVPDNRALVETNFEASKTLCLKAFRSLRNGLD